MNQKLVLIHVIILLVIINFKYSVIKAISNILQWLTLLQINFIFSKVPVHVNFQNLYKYYVVELVEPKVLVNLLFDQL